MQRNSDRGHDLVIYARSQTLLKLFYEVSINYFTSVLAGKGATPRPSALAPSTGVSIWQKLLT